MSILGGKSNFVYAGVKGRNAQFIANLCNVYLALVLVMIDGWRHSEGGGELGAPEFQR